MKISKSIRKAGRKGEHGDDRIYKTSAPDRITGNAPAREKGTYETRKRLQEAGSSPESKARPEGNQV